MTVECVNILKCLCGKKWPVFHKSAVMSQECPRCGLKEWEIDNIMILVDNTKCKSEKKSEDRRALTK